MRMCPNCRTRVNDGDMFCQTCGTPTLAAEGNGAPRRAPNVRCPQCGETQALKSSVVAAGKISRVYWLCHTCRNKFRDPRDLEKEMRSQGNWKIALVIGMVSMFAFFMLATYGASLVGKYNRLDYWTKMANEGLKALGILLIVMGFIGALIQIAIMLVFALKWRQLLQEKRELSGNPNQRGFM